MFPVVYLLLHGKGKAAPKQMPQDEVVPHHPAWVRLSY